MEEGSAVAMSARARSLPPGGIPFCPPSPPFPSGDSLAPPGTPSGLGACLLQVRSRSPRFSTFQSPLSAASAGASTLGHAQAMARRRSPGKRVACASPSGAGNIAVQIPLSAVSLQALQPWARHKPWPVSDPPASGLLAPRPPGQAPRLHSSADAGRRTTRQSGRGESTAGAYPLVVRSE